MKKTMVFSFSAGLPGVAVMAGSILANNTQY